MRINEIFYSLQGEGHYTGTPAVFVRFAGCNLKCSFCDTDHEPSTLMTEDDIVAEMMKYQARFAVMTGGEPTLQITASLTEKLHNLGWFIAMETNGTNPLPQGCHIDWITCSPKHKPLRIGRIDELKAVHDGDLEYLESLSAVDAKEYRLQPLDVKDEWRNKAYLESAITYCMQHPKWCLSLQTHKIINVR